MKKFRGILALLLAFAMLFCYGCKRPTVDPSDSDSESESVTDDPGTGDTGTGTGTGDTGIV